MSSPQTLSRSSKVAIFPVDGGDFEIIDPITLVDDWEEQWRSYAKYLSRFGDVPGR